MSDNQFYTSNLLRKLEEQRLTEQHLLSQGYSLEEAMRRSGGSVLPPPPPPVDVATRD